MNLSTVPCTHSCASGCPNTLQTWNPLNLRLPPLNACCLTSAKMSSRIELLFPQLTRKEPGLESPTKPKKKRDIWPSAKCLAISSLLVNWASWRCSTTRFCIGKSRIYSITHLSTLNFLHKSLVNDLYEPNISQIEIYGLTKHVYTHDSLC